MSVFLDCRKHDKMIDKMLREKNKAAVRRAEEKKLEPRVVALTVVGIPLSIVAEASRAPLSDRYDIRMLLPPSLGDGSGPGRSRLDPSLNYERYRALVSSSDHEIVQTVRQVLLKETGMTPTQEALQHQRGAAASQVSAVQDEDQERKRAAVAEEYGIKDWERRHTGKGERKREPSLERERELPDGYGDHHKDAFSAGDEDYLDDASGRGRALNPAKRNRQDEDDREDDEPQVLGPRERMARLLEQQIRGKAQRLDSETRRVAAASSDFDVQLAVLVGSATKKKDQKKKDKKKKKKKKDKKKGDKE